MATSETDICNLALDHLGERPIGSINDDSLAGRACQRLYDNTRDALLRSHRWNFAVARVALSRLAEDPPFGWSYRYKLPADCLRALEVNGSEKGDWITDAWAIEGREVLTDAESVNFVYIRKVRSVAEFDELFVEAFAAKLAMKLSETIRGTTRKTSDLAALYAAVVAPLARRVDANEGRRRKGLLPMNSLAIAARHSDC